MEMIGAFGEQHRYAVRPVHQRYQYGGGFQLQLPACHFGAHFGIEIIIAALGGKFGLADCRTAAGHILPQAGDDDIA